MHINNRHGRSVRRPASEVFADLEKIGTDDDRVWPAPSIPFVRTAGPLRVGETKERHGTIRAVLADVRPNRAIIWRIDQPFLQGTHGFEIEETPGGCRVVHTLVAKLAWWFIPVWFLNFRRIHDKILEQLLDRLAEAPKPKVDHARNDPGSRPISRRRA